MIEEENYALALLEEEPAPDEGVSDTQLATIIDQEMANGLGGDSSKLSEQRGRAMEYYLGEPYGNELPDRSNVVTREVLDTIEWIKPALMKIFASGDETVRFEPQGPQDVAGAQQETDYINYLFHRKNPGFKILYQWITDGLLQKNGVVKAWFDTTEARRRETYAELTPMELQMLAMDPDVEPVEISPNEDGMTVSASVLRKGACGGLKVEVIPPEEFIISRKAKDIPSSPFCAHKTRMTVSDLAGMGYDVSELGSGDDTGVQWEDESRARHRYDDTDRESLPSKPADDTMREVWVTEAYIRMDYDGDGLAELRRVLKVGSTILDNEEVDCMPFAGWTPIIISHKFHGLSVADLVMDLQRLQSQLFRNLIDNQYLTNNGRYAVIEGLVNIDDLLTSRPHGIVRQKMAGAVQRLDTPQLGATAFQMLEYVDRLREKRTGVSERSQGLDPSQLSANTAATAVNQVMVAAQERIELIARVFGETGLTDLFRLMHKLVIQNQTNKDIFRLRDEYVEVNPSEWSERTDTSVVVGLGNGSRESEMLQLNMIFQNQMALSANPKFGALVSPANIFHTLEDQVKVFNKAASGRHFTDPTSPEAMKAAQAAQQQQMQMMQMQLQMKEREFQIKQAELQLKGLKIAKDDENRKADLGIKQQAHNLNEQEHVDDVALRTAEMSMEYELESEQKRAVDVGS